MSTVMLRVVLFITVVLVPSAGYSQDREFGRYRVATVSDGVLGMRCQPRQEFYLLPAAPAPTEATYLGTCGAPRFIKEQVRLPVDPSCFAISESGASMVYFHRPEVCGAGEKAKGKPGGIYLHSVESGDRLLYPQSQISEIWGGAPVPPGAMRVAWFSRTPSKEGAQCGQTLLIRADGHATVEGTPEPRHPLCR